MSTTFNLLDSKYDLCTYQWSQKSKALARTVSCWCKNSLALNVNPSEPKTPFIDYIWPCEMKPGR